MAVTGRYNDAKNDLLHAIWDQLTLINGKSVDLTKRTSRAGFSTVTEDLLFEVLQELTEFQGKALANPMSVANLTALQTAATGTRPKLIICQSDPSYSTDPTLNYWDGNGNLIVFAGEKRNI
jgi:hypothetical protein